MIFGIISVSSDENEYWYNISININNGLIITGIISIL